MPEPHGPPLPSAAAYLGWRSQNTATADGAVAARGAEELTGSDQRVSALIRQDADALHSRLLDESPSRLVSTRFGALRLDDYMRTRNMSLVIHGLDIAMAIGKPWTPPKPQMLEVLRLLSEIAVMTDEGSDLMLLLSERTPPQPGDVLPVLR